MSVACHHPGRGTRPSASCRSGRQYSCKRGRKKEQKSQSCTEICCKTQSCRRIFTPAVHLPHVCCSGNGFIAQDLWCWNQSTRPTLATMLKTQSVRDEVPDSPTYSGVPRISLTSVILSMRRDKPKSTIRMSPKGLALVNKMFWGWRRNRLDKLLLISFNSPGICNIWKKCLWTRQVYFCKL